MDKSFRTSIFVGIGLILGSIILFLVVSTILSDGLATTSADIMKNKKAIATRAAFLGSLAEIKSGSAEAGTLKQKMDALLVTQEQLLALSQYLSGLSNVYKISLSFSFKGSPTPPQGSAPGYELYSVDASGNLDSLSLFVNNIEANSTKYLLSMENFELTYVDTSNYRLSFQGKVYFR